MAFIPRRRKRPRRRRAAQRSYNRTPLTVAQILAWADAFHRARGRWPHCKEGIVPGTLSETWTNLDQALRKGLRGLPGGSSLAQLLAEQRGVRNPKGLPALSVATILAWCDTYYRRHGAWPTAKSGPIPEAPGEHWSAIEAALLFGHRGLRGGSSLARLLARARGKRNIGDLPPLTVRQILAWADAHHRRSGRWPTERSGTIVGTRGETWGGVQCALADGYRGLPGGTSLAQLLAQQRGVRNHMALPPLQVHSILGWADAHQRRTGQWPGRHAGPIAEAPGETWLGIEMALRHGRRGLPGKSSLRRLLAQWRDAPAPERPRLQIAQVLRWADAHQEQTGKWPGQKSGPVCGVAGETWLGIDQALRDGRRGLPRGLSVARLLAQQRGVPNPADRPRLTVPRILAWADAHQRRTGCWPTAASGSIGGVVGETWRNVNVALEHGYRGLPGGSSLAQLLAQRRRVGPRQARQAPVLRREQIRAWAEAHRRRTGRWPTGVSEPIAEAPGETWRGVDHALREGKRGLEGSSSLSRLESEAGDR